VPHNFELSKLRVLAHPLRMRILSLLTGAAMSAAEIARELEDTQPNVSYHLRRLHDAGLLFVAEEVSIRGGRAKRYRHDPDSGIGMHGHDPEEEQLLAAVLGDELRRRTAYRLPDSGTTTDAELWVDSRVWQHCLEQARELGRVLHEAAKPPRTPGTRRVSTTIAMFAMDSRR
jgi:DNA-binding transcriptional ArsR family regulator